MRRALTFMLLGCLAVMLALELLFRLLPTSTATRTGYYIDPLIVTYAPHHEFTLSSGWSLANPHRSRSNNFGFLTSREFVPDRSAVALIGDSFVDEAFLAEDERLGMTLERELSGRPVYAMGSPGSSLLDYAERIRFAHDRFGIIDFVLLLERGDIRQALCGSHNVQGPCLDPETLSPRIETTNFPTGFWRDVARQSALAQYLFSQLQLNPLQFSDAILSRLKHDATPRAEPFRGPTDLSGREVDAIVHAFFGRVQAYRQGRLVLVFDVDHRLLNRGETAADPVQDRVKAAARSFGALVVEVEPHFREYLARTGLRLEISPADAHWNREANRLAAKAIAEALRSSR
jgi:hypothetical protein